MLELVLATRNPSKALEIQRLFVDTPFLVLTLDEAGIKGEAVEDGATLGENARKKARFAHKALGGTHHCIAEDTGLFIRALGGRPGIHAARWAGSGKSTEEIMQHTLREMNGTSDRAAFFRTCAVLVTPSGSEHTFEGEVAGTILAAPKVRPQPRMPYSGIFKPDGTTRVWAEMDTDEENRISHRGIAFSQLRSFLSNRYR